MRIDPLNFLLWPRQPPHGGRRAPAMTERGVGSLVYAGVIALTDHTGANVAYPPTSDRLTTLEWRRQIKRRA